MSSASPSPTTSGSTPAASTPAASTPPESTSASPTSPDATGNPLDAALAAEDAAVFAYGAVGAFVGDDQRAYVANALTSHRGARDWLRERLVAAGAQPGAAAPAYELPDITDATTAAAVAASVELALVPRWSAVAGAVGSVERPFCTAQAQACAVRGLTWGAEGQAFPGTGAVTMASPSASASASDEVSPAPEAGDAQTGAPEAVVPVEPMAPEAVVPIEPMAPEAIVPVEPAAP